MPQAAKGMYLNAWSSLYNT